MSEKWSVHASMDAGDIARVMEWRETALNGRKFGEQDMIKDLREIAYRFLAVYRGDFEWLATQRMKFTQFGRLFDSTLAGILNCMVKSVETELQQTVRAEIHKQKKSARPGEEMGQGSASTPAKVETAQTVPDGTYSMESETGKRYLVDVVDGHIRLKGVEKDPFDHLIGREGTAVIDTKSGKVSSVTIHPPIKDVNERPKRKGALKINMGARPVVGELFSDEDMAGGRE